MRHGLIGAPPSRRQRPRPSRFAARSQATLGIAGPIAVALLMPTPGSQLAMLTDPRPDIVVGAIAMLIAITITWLLVGWALVVFSAAAASRLPGSAGRGARWVVTAITPALVRRVVLAAAGVSVAAGLTACGPASPAGAHTAPAAIVAAVSAPDGAASGFSFDLDWPITEPAAPDRTQSPAPPAPEPEPASRTATHQARSNSAPHNEPSGVTVQRGDSLWSIAAAHLPTGATNAEIDSAWRAWYAANRDVVGADPNIVIPGQLLQPPTGPTDSATAAQETAR